VLDRTLNSVDTKIGAELPDGTLSRPAPSGVDRFTLPFRRAWRFSVTQSFSSLTRRIIFLNVTGLLALVVGILYLSQFRAGLIDARVQSLLVQGDIIARAIAASATADSDTVTVDPGRLLDLQTGESYDPTEDYDLDFAINPGRVAPVLRNWVSPTKTRARIYDRDGGLILDTQNMYDVSHFDLPPPSADKPGVLQRAFVAVRTWLNRGDLPLYRELPPQGGKGYEEVARALAGSPWSMVRVNDRGEVIVSVALPVQRFVAVRGALMLSTQGGEIDSMVAAERLGIVKVFLVAASVMVVLSFLLAGTIAGPVRRLAGSAEVVRRRVRSRVEIPDFTTRNDEIGHLSGALRDMTDALYSRIEAIESFAADVAHELKNPLTSLRSAVETLPLAKTDTSRERLLSVIQHDVQRLDRLISDISDASRVEAELQRQETGTVDLNKLLATVVSVANEVRHGDGVSVALSFEGERRSFLLPGHDSRLGQVFYNLIDNARSFSPPGGCVRIACRHRRDEIEITVDDDGPGVPPDAMEKVFERFYTDRPHQGFGQNSGLGLSICRQIVEAHGGRMWAENRVTTHGADQGPAPGADRGPADVGEPARVAGARFVVQLPAM
jgi:two-component system sensor histidine kinase ChvG